MSPAATSGVPAAPAVARLVRGVAAGGGGAADGGQVLAVEDARARGHRAGGVEVAFQRHLAGDLGGGGGAEGDGDVLERAGDDVAVAVGAVALDEAAVGGDELVGAVEVERAVAGVLLRRRRP